MTIRPTGYKQDPPDTRDRPLGAMRLQIADLPGAFTLRNHVHQVLDQSITQSCVAHSTCQAVRIALSVQGVKDPILPSREFVYYNARMQTGGELIDDGTYIRDAFKALSRYGYCEEKFWPFDVAKVNDQPSPNAYRMAYDQRIDSFYRVVGPVEEGIKAAIVAGHPAVFGTAVDSEWMHYTGGVWSFGGEGRGGHAMCVVGYDERGVEIVNSWDTTWGESGFGWISWASMRNNATDIWVPKVVAQFSEVA